MIHPMWQYYFTASLTGLCQRSYQVDGVDAIPVDAVAYCAAKIADLACAEFDKRDAPSSQPRAEGVSG